MKAPRASCDANPPRRSARLEMRVVQHAALVVPLVLSAHGHIIAEAYRRASREVNVMRDEQRLAARGADDEALVPRRARILGEDARHAARHGQHDARNAVVERLLRGGGAVRPTKPWRSGTLNAQAPQDCRRGDDTREVDPGPGLQRRASVRSRPLTGGSTRCRQPGSVRAGRPSRGCSRCRS